MLGLGDFKQTKVYQEAFEEGLGQEITKCGFDFAVASPSRGRSLARGRNTNSPTKLVPTRSARGSLVRFSGNERLIGVVAITLDRM
jgi:hypothetical protein